MGDIPRDVPHFMLLAATRAVHNNEIFLSHRTSFLCQCHSLCSFCAINDEKNGMRNIRMLQFETKKVGFDHVPFSEHKIPDSGQMEL